MDAKPIEVIMRIDFAASDGKQIVAHAEKVQELVRCKDCKHYRDSFPYDICDVFDAMATDEDDFCSYGERKERSEDAEIHN